MVSDPVIQIRAMCTGIVITFSSFSLVLQRNSLLLKPSVS